MEIFDIKCSVCQAQLNFFETKDADGDIIYLVDPCPSCLGVENPESDTEGLTGHLTAL